MKKIILTLFGVFIAFPVIGQNINNHWILGNVDLDFSTNPPTANTISNEEKYGYASVSDENGNLLFYAGEKKIYYGNSNVYYYEYGIYNKNHQKIGQFYYHLERSNIRNIFVILPFKNDSKKFVVYMATEENFISTNSSTLYMLEYCIVDFNIDPNGSVVAYLGYSDQNTWHHNGQGTGILTVRNQELDNDYLLFLASHNYSNSYKIYNAEPAIDSYGNYNEIQLLEEGNFFPSNYIYSGSTIKIKSNINGSKIGGSIMWKTYDDAGGNPDVTAHTYNIYYKFFVIDFNVNNLSFSNFISFGEESFNKDPQEVSYVPILSDIEFSTDSQKVYYTKNGAVYVKDLLNLSTPEHKLAITGNPSNFPDGFEHLQKDKYGNIWISSSLSVNHRNKYLHKINNPNSFSGSSIDVNSIYLNNNTIPQSFGLPFLIPDIQSCVEDIYITATLSSGNSDNQEASNSITASNIIQNNATASYKAGNSILLSDGFNVEWGAEFRAYIEDCTTSAPRTRKVTNTNESLDNKQNITIRLYPNPNNGNFEVSFSSILNEEVLVEIYDVNSRLIDRFTEKMNNKNSISVNNDNLKSGIYLVKISSQSISETIKFIKK